MGKGIVILLFLFLLLTAGGLFVLFAFDLREVTGHPVSDKESCLAFTFDDGYKSHHDTVMPLLEKFGDNATFYIIVGNNEFYLGKQLMTSDEVRELISRGFEIGS